MFDYIIANYEIMEMGNWNTSYSVVYIAHCVVGFMFMMQYLVAVLKTAYDRMLKDADFYAIEYQYIFITKYMRAIEENNGYDKLISYPPPLNVLVVPILIFFFSRDTVLKIANIVTFIIFWIENIFLIAVFYAYLIVLDIQVVLRHYLQIFVKVQTIKAKLKFLVMWTFVSPFYLFYTNICDMCMLLNILCMENSESFDKDSDEKLKMQLHKYNIYKEIVAAMI
jgi:hypothetical protein